MNDNLLINLEPRTNQIKNIQKHDIYKITMLIYMQIFFLIVQLYIKYQRLNVSFLIETHLIFIYHYLYYWCMEITDSLQYFIENHLMFRFYISSQYRRLYGQLSSMQLLSDTLVIRFQDYQQYFHHLVIIEPGIDRQIEVLYRQKMSVVKLLKILFFIHAWLQSTCVIEQPQSVLDFINWLFGQVGELAGRLRASRTVSERKLSRSTVLRDEGGRGEQLECSKELFLLEEVAKPYLYYLQKLVSIFDYYNSLKKNFIKPMNSSQIWVLVNLLRCIIKVTNQVPPICRFVRKSYRPVAEGLAQALSQDVGNFYPKLYKYCYGEVARVRGSFFQAEGEGEQEAFRRSAEGVESMVALLDEVGQVNRSLRILLEEPTVQQLQNLFVPKLIDVAGNEFELIYHLHKLKKSGYPQVIGTLVTPKFFITHGSQPTLLSDQGEEKDDKEDIQTLLPVFRDISNEQEQVVTFRQQKPGKKGLWVRRRQEPLRTSERLGL